MTTLEEAKTAFVELLSSVQSAEDRHSLLQWISEEVEAEQEPDYVLNGRKQLRDLSEFIVQEMDNTEAIFSSEQLHFPTKFAADDDSNLRPENTLHVDGFLYDGEAEEQLVNAGVLPRGFCQDCGSKNTQEYHYITHSSSKDVLEYIFTRLLPPLSSHTRILDVGSRLGAVLYGAYFFTPSQHITGVEMNADHCQLQCKVIKAFNLSERIQIEHAEVSTRLDLLAESNVVILNNVFEFFIDRDEDKVVMWNMLRKTLQPGTLVVTVPSLEKSLLTLKVLLHNY